MARGSISHIALSVSDLERSAAFYNKVFEFIGFKSVEIPDSIQQAMKTRLKAWVGPGYDIDRLLTGEFSRRLHDRKAPGSNHMAFTADDRSDVEEERTSSPANWRDSTRRTRRISVFARVLCRLFH